MTRPHVDHLLEGLGRLFADVLVALGTKSPDHEAMTGTLDEIYYFLYITVASPERWIMSVTLFSGSIQVTDQIITQVGWLSNLIQIVRKENF